MPSLLLISASGTAQRRLLEETVADHEKKGYVISGRQEGGEWGPLLSDNLSGGLFDEKRIVIVESAALMAKKPVGVDDVIDINLDDYGIKDLDKRRDIINKGSDLSAAPLKKLAEKYGL